MNTTFVTPNQVLPRWMGSTPTSLFECDNKQFESGDTGRAGLAVPDLVNGRAGHLGSVSQQHALLPSHRNQGRFKSVVRHERVPLSDSLTESGLINKGQTNQTRLNDDVSICCMQSTTPSRIVLADNVNRLMTGALSLNSNTKMVKRSGLGLGTIGRVRNADAAATIHTIDMLAACFNIKPWELLTPYSSYAAQPVLEFSPAPAEPAGLQLSGSAQELAVLFDLLTGRDGKIDKADVFTAAVEAISRTVTGRHAPTTDAQQPAGPAKKQSF